MKQILIANLDLVFLIVMCTTIFLVHHNWSFIKRMVGKLYFNISLIQFAIKMSSRKKEIIKDNDQIIGKAFRRKWIGSRKMIYDK